MANISHFTQTVNGVSTTYDIHDANAVDLSSNQTVAGNKEFTGTTTAHDVIPSATDTYNFGSPSYQWNNAYIKSLTINGVVCGDILTHNVSEFVNVTGAQTIGGVKTFSSNVIIQGSKKVTCNLDNSFIELDGGTTWGKGGSIVLSGQDRSSYTNSVLIVSKSDTNTDILQYQNGELKPLSNNTNNSSLGTPTNKWKSFNGINPGALSLPSVSSGINLDLTNFKTDGSDNKFRLTNFSNYPYDNGWLFVRLNGCTSYYLDHWYKVVSNSYATPSEAIFFMPINDKDHDITLRCTCTSINYIRVFPCQGNV